MKTSRFAGRREHVPIMHTLLPCPTLAGLVPVGAGPWALELDGDPRNGENQPWLDVSSQCRGERAGSSVCVHMCV